MVECVMSVPDPRRGNHRKHELADMLFASLVSVLCGYDSYVAFARFTELNLEWMRGLGFAFRNGVPSHDTFRYAFSVVDHGLFSACLRNVSDILRDKARKGSVSIDGKALRRCMNRGGKTPYIVNAWADADGIVLGEVKVDEKSNEITAIPGILRLLGLEGCTVTIDAAGCQKSIMRQGGDRARGGQPRVGAQDGTFAGRAVGETAEVRNQGCNDVCEPVKGSEARNVDSVASPRRSPKPRLQHWRWCWTADR